MSVLVYLENWEGKFKKNTWEAALYASKTAEMLGTEAIGVTIGNLEDDASQAGKYGVGKVVSLCGDAYTQFDANVYGAALQEVAKAEGADTIILSGTFNAKALAPALAVYAEAALLSNVTALPIKADPFTVKRGVFSAKGFNELSATAANKVVVFVPNSIGLEEGEGSAELSEMSVSPETEARVSVQEVDRVKGKIPLPEAEKVVSGGRGLKGPENWGMLEELAEVLDAGTACSKPVSDMDWRPHSEHVGQTGIAIKPNLYIAIGISGAIQHLAGVSSSNTIVVINKDDEAPFFKAADYGVVGDAFEVIPKLTEAIKKFKAEN
jgi:electron transfer flavoprotein alpha subunit